MVIAVLAAVVVPFSGFALYVHKQMAVRLSKDVVVSSLQGLSEDLARRIDRDVDDRITDIEQLTSLPLVPRTLWEEQLLEILQPEVSWGPEQVLRVAKGEALDAIDPAFRDIGQLWDLTRYLDEALILSGRFELLVVLDGEGNLVTCSSRTPEGSPMEAAWVEELFNRDFSTEPWFGPCMSEGRVSVDRHRSSLLPPRNNSPGEHPENYSMGFGGRIDDVGRSGEALGAVYGLVSWSGVQARLREPLLISVYQGLVGQGTSPSAYAWVWASDADTIFAHPQTELYGTRVSEPPVDLPQLVEAARTSRSGLYPEYEFDGHWKNAAFTRTKLPSEGHFDWVVGVGIDNSDIYRAVDELRAILYRATALVVLVALLWTMVIARRTTSPIVELSEHTRRVAGGDLEARIAIRTGDELEQLGDDFNRMTQELAHNRAQIIAAEKDSAWREMSRQIAHDIKNPLTPIQLSVDLMQRAKEERSPKFDEIFERTLETITRQVDHLREIASDFHALTGDPRQRPEAFDLAALVGEVLALHDAYAQELGIEVESSLEPHGVYLDRSLLRRVIVNLVSNAFEAMPDGGRFEIRLDRVGDRVRLEMRDTGVGLSDEIREHLFEPYFTTRSHGTGLGLAIAKRVIDEMDGSIELIPMQDEAGGTLARIVLPSGEDRDRDGA